MLVFGGGLPTVTDMVVHDFSESTKVVLLLMAGLKITEEIYLFFGPGLETMKSSKLLLLTCLIFSRMIVAISSVIISMLSANP